MALPKASADLQVLQKSINTTKALISQYQVSLKSDRIHGSVPPSSTAPQPLHLLSTAASLFRAQVTKLSLLVLNKPFTPSAIDYVIGTLSSSILPSLMTAWELCYHPRLPRLLQSHVKTSLVTILRELLLLLDSVPVNEHGIEQEIGSRDTLANTGVIWEVCDQLIKVGDDGVGHLAVQRATQDLALFEDAIGELKGWEPGESDDFMTDLSVSDQSSDEDYDENICAKQIKKAEAIDLFQDLRPLVSKLPGLLECFPTLNKQTNISTGHDDPTIDQCYLLDAILETLRHLTEDSDELAGALYADDSVEVAQSMAKLEQTIERCERLKPNAWDLADHLSDWSQTVIGP